MIENSKGTKLFTVEKSLFFMWLPAILSEAADTNQLFDHL